MLKVFNSNEIINPYSNLNTIIIIYKITTNFWTEKFKNITTIVIISIMNYLPTLKFDSKIDWFYKLYLYLLIDII